jgi:hypothetical protein
VIAVIGMRHFSSLDLVPSRMAGSFAAVSGADVGSASDMPIAVKLLYLDDLVLTPIDQSRVRIARRCHGSFGPGFF